jgi:hypothetical protein
MSETKTGITLSDDGRDPWDRQPDESQKMYDQFVVFRDLGRARHWKKLADRFNITTKTAASNCAKYRWSERASAYDAYMDQQWVAVMAENSRRNARDHIRVARTLLTKLEERLTTLDPDKINNADFVRMTDLWSKLSRVAAGEPDTHIAVTGHPAHPPVMVTTVPGDEETRQKQMRSAAVELARRLSVQTGLNAEDILDMDM